MKTDAQSSEFVVKQLRLENYRCFQEISVCFDDELTVFVAPNGGGKTALLDALSIALRLFVDTMESRSNSKGFDAKDIRLFSGPANMMEYATPVRLECNGLIFGEKVSWARERQSVAASRTTTAEALDLKRAATKISFANQTMGRIKKLTWKDLKDMPMFPIFPIISYYGTGRLWSSGRLTEQKRVKLAAPNARTRGYTDCLSSSSHYKYFIDWFRRFSYEAEKEKAAPTENSVHSPSITLNAVTIAVDAALLPSGWNHIEWDFVEDVIVANHPIHGRLPVDFLSDGIRSVIGLVADIAHRMAKLNPHLDANITSQTPGVVLIDEVDMHLHPEWQQQILGSLRAAFPLVQFVVSTHSPQVLSTVRKENIRILSSIDDVWTAEEPSKSPLGHESQEALATIMSTHPRPPLPEILELVHLYEQLIKSGRGDSREAHEVLEKLSVVGFEFGDAEMKVLNFLRAKAIEKREQNRD